MDKELQIKLSNDSKSMEVMLRIMADSFSRQHKAVSDELMGKSVIIMSLKKIDAHLLRASILLDFTMAFAHAANQLAETDVPF